MTPEEQQQFLAQIHQKAVDLLVDRGFARRAIINEVSDECRIALTEDGKILLKHLKHLFSVPPTSVASLTPQVIVPVIALILHIDIDEL